MIIEKFLSPKAPSMAQQVERNKCDIKELKTYIKPYYKCTLILDEAAEVVDITATNVPIGTENGFIVDKSGKLFNIITITDNNVIIDYWANLTIGG